MRAIDVIEDPKAAAAALDPVRSRLLAELAREPASAAGVAPKVGLTRQKANYYLRTLEELGLIELAEVRMRGGITERVLRAVAASYVVSPTAMAEGGASPERVQDHLSAEYLIALAGRTVHEVGTLARKAEAAGRRLPTFTIDTEVRFRSAKNRAAFADELAAAVLDLVGRYHDDGGRPYRIVAAAHPALSDRAAVTEPPTSPAHDSRAIPDHEEST